MTDYQDSGTEPSAVEKLIASGAGATGIAAGAALGFLIGGPLGAAAGGAAGALLQDGTKEVVGQVANRLITQTEMERVGSCLLVAQELISTRLNGGEPLREASFFQPRIRRKNTRLRSEAAELLEGTFLAARDSYEERKIELLARFYANAVFERHLDAAHLNHLLSLAKGLTYRQLTIAAVLGDGNLATVRSRDFRNEQTLPHPVIGLLFEIYQMIGLDLVVSSTGNYMLGVADINPSQLRLQGDGAHLYNLMHLAAVDEAEKRFFFDMFLP